MTLPRASSPGPLRPVLLSYDADQNIKNGFTLSTYFSGKRLMAKDWISQAEAARIRGVSRQAIARLVKKGRFQVFEIGGRILLSRSEVQSYKPEDPGRPAK